MAAVEKRVLQKPSNVVHGFMKDGHTVRIWLMGDNKVRIEGKIVGYDEFMNLVLDEAVQVNSKQQ